MYSAGLLFKWLTERSYHLRLPNACLTALCVAVRALTLPSALPLYSRALPDWETVPPSRCPFNIPTCVHVATESTIEDSFIRSLRFIHFGFQSTLSETLQSTPRLLWLWWTPTHTLSLRKCFPGLSELGFRTGVLISATIALQLLSGYHRVVNPSSWHFALVIQGLSTEIKPGQISDDMNVASIQKICIRSQLYTYIRNIFCASSNGLENVWQDLNEHVPFLLSPTLLAWKQQEIEGGTVLIGIKLCATASGFPYCTCSETFRI